MIFAALQQAVGVINGKLLYESGEGGDRENILLPSGREAEYDSLNEW